MANNSTNKRKRNNNSNYNSPNQQHARFAQSSAQFLGLTASTTAGVDVARIKTMIQDPSKNSLQIGNISKALKHVNGEYKRIIQYMSSLLTYDHTIYPVMQNPTVDAGGDVTAMQQAFAQTAIYLDRLNPKLNLPLFTEKMFTTGVTFLYKLEDSKESRIKSSLLLYAVSSTAKRVFIDSSSMLRRSQMFYIQLCQRKSNRQ